MILSSVVKGTFARHVRPQHLQRLHTAVESVLKRKIDGTVAIVCVSDRTMQMLNRRYRRKNKTTDVLSFLYAERRTLRTHTIAGDILLAIPEVRRQAHERRLPLSDVTNELIVHGFLHLLGYDHERSRRDAQGMFQFQEMILKAIQKT